MHSFSFIVHSLNQQLASLTQHDTGPIQILSSVPLRNAVSAGISMKTKKKRRMTAGYRVRFAEHKVKILESALQNEAHGEPGRMYFDMKTAERLAEETGLTEDQVKQWLRNKNKRNKILQRLRADDSSEMQDTAAEGEHDYATLDLTSISGIQSSLPLSITEDVDVSAEPCLQSAKKSSKGKRKKQSGYRMRFPEHNVKVLEHAYLNEASGEIGMKHLQPDVVVRLSEQTGFTEDQVKQWVRNRNRRIKQLRSQTQDSLSNGTLNRDEDMNEAIHYEVNSES